MSATVGRDAAGPMHVRLELGALVLGALDADDRARVEAHLAGCGCGICKVGKKGPSTRHKWMIGH